MKDYNGSIQQVWNGGFTCDSLGLSISGDRVGLKDETKLQSVYTICRKIGEGAMGQVYSAIHNESQNLLVVKFVPRPKRKQSIYRRTFESDDKLFAFALNVPPHPNIANILDIVATPDMYIIALDPLTGRELVDCIEEGASMEFVKDVSKQITSVLAYVHKNGVIHRDIKLDAFRFRTKAKDSPLCVLDFGMATKINSNVPRCRCGTFEYMAPEMAKGKIYNEKVDVFSFGICLYVMLEVDFPYLLDRPSFELYWTEKQAMKILNEVDFPRPMKKFIKELLAFNPDNRLSAAEAYEMVCSDYVWTGFD